MTADLPTLKDVKEMAQAEINSYAILGDKINIRYFLDDTFANFEKLIKVHAADYHSLLNVTPVGIARIQVEAARDAILKLAGKKTMEELEGEINGKGKKCSG